MRAIVTVTGKDKVGIIAGVSGLLSELNVNIEDISQTILGGFFTMFMLVDVPESLGVALVAGKLDELGKNIGVSAVMQSEEVYNAMHRI